MKKFTPKRTELAKLNFAPNQIGSSPAGIVVEKWWIPMDDVQESMTTIAIGGYEGEKVAFFVMKREQAIKLASDMLKALGVSGSK